MPATTAPVLQRPLHPLHAILLAFPVPLFLGALLSDWTYAETFQVQWSNFAAWLNAGALVGGGFALIWSLIDAVRWRGRAWLVVLLLLAMWGLGLVNAFVHGKDAYAVMPEGLWLSAVVAVLALAAAWLGFSRGTRDVVARGAPDLVVRRARA